MDTAQLDPVAGHLIEAYVDTWQASRTFKDQYGFPLTVAARAHHLRSIAQARLTQDERYELDPEYAEHGRVQFADREASRVYLLRSLSATVIERHKRESSIFDARPYTKSDVVMLVYSFQQSGITLSVAGTCRKKGRRRLEASGKPIFVGNWPFAPTDATPFDQQVIDPFGDLGELDIDEDEAE